MFSNSGLIAAILNASKQVQSFDSRSEWHSEHSTAWSRGRRAAPYGFVSEGVSVGSEQGGLRPQEGPRHAAPRGRGLLLELAFQGGHLVSGGGGARK